MKKADGPGNKIMMTCNDWLVMYYRLVMLGRDLGRDI